MASTNSIKNPSGEVNSADGESSTELISQLRDIHLPDPTSAWPLSMLAWISIVFILLLIFLFLYLFLRQRQPKQPTALALGRLNECYSDWQKTGSDTQYLEQSTVVLKRFALSLYGRGDVARLSGSEWLRWLNGQTTRPLTSDTQTALTSACYQKSPQTNVEHLHNDLVRWIKSVGQPDHA